MRLSRDGAQPAADCGAEGSNEEDEVGRAGDEGQARGGGREAGPQGGSSLRGGLSLHNASYLDVPAGSRQVVSPRDRRHTYMYVSRVH